MKKLYSVLLCCVLLAGNIITGMAQSLNISDDCSTKDKLFDNSQNIICEAKNIATVKNANYITSTDSQYYLIYNLEDLKGFEMKAFDYATNAGSVTFSVSDEADENYIDITDIVTVQKASLNSAWNMNTYNYIGKTSYNYLKIEVNQTSGKYFRIDNVDVFADGELKADKVTFFDAEGKVLENNIYLATEMQIQFNMSINNAPLLTIDETTVEPENSDKNMLVYKFSPQDLGIHKFKICNILYGDNKTFDFEQEYGYAAEIDMAENMHMGEEYPVKLTLIDSNGIKEDIKDFSINIEGDVAESNGNIITPIKPGDTIAEFHFEKDGVATKLIKNVHICNIKTIVTNLGVVELKSNEETVIDIFAELDDGTKIPIDEPILTINDTSVAEITDGKICAKSKGRAILDVTVNYYGTVKVQHIPIGVDVGVQPIISNAYISVDSGSIKVGQNALINIKITDAAQKNVDTFAANVVYIEDNKVISISDNGVITGIGEGETQISAQITMNGVSLKTNSIDITVKKPQIATVKFRGVENSVCVGDSFEADSVVYYDNQRIVDKSEYAVIYSSDNEDILKFSGNTARALRSGKAMIKAQIICDGKEIISTELIINVVDSQGEYKDLLDNWDRVFYHTDNLIFSGNADSNEVMTNGANIKGEYIVWKSDDDIKSITVYATSLTEEIRDFAIYLSEDNINYTKLNYDDITYTTIGSKNGWKNVEYYIQKTGNAKYVKVEFTKQNGNTQGTRLCGIKISKNKEPEILGMSIVNSLGVLLPNGYNSEKIILNVGQNVGQSADIYFKSDEEKIVPEYEIDNNKIYINSNCLEKNKEYLLLVSGLENIYETQMKDLFSGNISTYEKYHVNGIEKEDNSVVVKIIGEEKSKDVYVYLYEEDDNGNIIRIERKNVYLEDGINDVLFNLDASNDENMKVIVAEN